MGMAVPIYHTAEMVRALTDESRHWPRYEVVHGELLVRSAPRMWHQVIVGRLFLELTHYLERNPGIDALAFTSPSDISWGPDTLVQPDVRVIPLAEVRTLAWKHVRMLLLAAEVLSPSSVRADRFTKRRLYQEFGVETYWVVEADERYVEIWTPGVMLPDVERETLTWTPAGATAPFELSLEALFRPI